MQGSQRYSKVEDIVRNCSFTEPHSSSYSPDLALNDFFLLKNMKKVFRGINNYFADLPMTQLNKHLEKCVSAERSFAEKYNIVS